MRTEEPTRTWLSEHSNGDPAEMGGQDGDMGTATTGSNVEGPNSTTHRLAGEDPILPPADAGNRGLPSPARTPHSGSVPAPVHPPTPPSEDYARRIAGELSALGIPLDYAACRQLSLQPEATELVVARVLSDGRELRLEPGTATAWISLVSAAATEEITLLLISGFRSVDYQRDILLKKRAAGASMETILSVNAAPGYSEHHTGRAVDIGTPGCPPLSEAFESTAAFAWLQSNARRFGFQLSYPRNNPHGVIYEPWHWFRTGLTASPG